jgi:hypothetical protein
VQDEVLGVDELAVEPQRGGRVGKILACDKAVAHRALLHTLVEARQQVFGAGERPIRALRGSFETS